MKLHPLLFLFFLLCTLISCQSSNTKSTSAEAASAGGDDTFYQYSIWWAFTNKVFDADLTVKDLKAKGDVGLGSFDMLDGEMVMVGGIPYRIREDGKVTEGADTDEIVYANAVHFQKDESFTIPESPISLDSLQQLLKRKMASPNYFYAVVVRGKFSRLKCGGVPTQVRPFVDGLDVLIPNRPVFDGTDISGTMVGFYCPDFIGNINAKGFHFHFISDDHTFGGHVMEMETSGELAVEMDKKTNYSFQLPDNADFREVRFDKEFQYKKD